MKLQEFVTNLNSAHFSLSVENGKLNLTGDRSKLSAQEIDAIRSNKEVIDFIKTNRNALIEYVSEQAATATFTRSNNIESIYRLSGLQQGILFHGLYERATESHKVHFRADLLNVNTDIFIKTWEVVFQKHTALRTGFHYDAFNVPVQTVYRNVQMPVEIFDWEDLKEEDQAAALKNFEEADRAKEFDFKAAPLMRLTLIRLGANRFRMLWTYHHILFDGWSLPIIMEEVLTTYGQLLQGVEPAVPTEDRFEDYIKYLDRSDKFAEEGYWKQYVQGLEKSTLLPFIENTATRNKGKGTFSAIQLRLDDEATAGIQSFAQQNRITVNTLMQGVWALLLHRYTGSNDVAYGVVVSGRPDDLEGVEKRVGLYINTLPLRAIINEEQEVTGWLQQLQATQVASRQYQHTPLQDIQRFTGVQGDLFDTLLVFENYPVSKVIASKQWSLQVENVKVYDPTNYPLTILIHSAEQINVTFHYNTALLKEAYVHDIQSHFRQVLLQLTKPLTTLKQIDFLSAAERERLINGFNNTLVQHPTDRSLSQIFEQQVMQTPGAAAVVFDDAVLTYTQLNERANQVAHYLLSKGIKPQSLVPVCIERGINMVVGVMGILKAGAAYVPIDPAYPAERISYMLSDLNAAVVVSSKASSARMAAGLAVEVIELDTDRVLIEKQAATNPDINIKPHHLAFVLYTSGSTGVPKGVKMPGGALVNLLHWQKSQFSERKRHVLQFASLNFDVSFLEIFSSVCFGSVVYLVDEERRKDMAELLRIVERHRITHLFMPYIVLKTLAETAAVLNWDVSSLEQIITAGEQLKLTPDIHSFLRKNRVTLINQYGPTEAHVVSSYTISQDYRLGPLPPIGKPIDNVQIYILDKAGRLCPPGIAGELLIGGVQVAEGYLNRPELTAEKFIIDPFSAIEGARLYKTGDLSRWLPDGNIEFLGRIDDQVKIRGFRVELGEIESVLQQSGLVRKTVVIAKEDKSGTRQLVGYVVPEARVGKAEIVAYLNNRLPNYMVPALWVEMDELPLSPNGKVDRKALLAVDLTDQSTREYEAPQNMLQQQLAAVWQELLGIEKIGIHDNFFELGGHSILAMQAISAIRRRMKLEVSIKHLFIYPTIHELTNSFSVVEQASTLPMIARVDPRPESVPLSFAQERLWFIDKLDGSVPYHMSSALRLQGTPDVAALQNALQTVVERHEVLRTVIDEADGEPFQKIQDAGDWTLKNYEAPPDIAGLQTLIRASADQPFVLSKDYMFRADLLKVAADDYVLVVTMHHIASDGWSLSIVVKEVVELYRSFVQHTEANLPTLQVQYADFAIWQRTNITGEVLNRKLAYWKQKLAGVTALQLPTDFARPAVQTTHGDVVTFFIRKGLLLQVQALSRQQGATLFATLLAAFKVLLYRYTGQEDICVGAPTANRTYKEVEDLVGLFLNTLAFRSNVEGNASFIRLLQQVKVTTFDAYEHQEVPFEKVVEAVVSERDTSRNALFQVMFVLQNTPVIPVIELGGVILSPQGSVNKSSKFDLSFSITESADGLHGSVLYNTGLFKQETIGRMLEHYSTLLMSIVKAPYQQVGALQMLTAAELQQLQKVFNDTNADYPVDKTVIELFEAQVQKTPSAPALVFGREQLAYKELNERSNQLAWYLQSCGVGAESLVPVCMEKSLEMMIGILGVLKAGGAYVPVDPAYPAERISFMLQDTKAKIVLTGKVQRSKLAGIVDDAQMLALDADWERISAFSGGNLNTKIDGGQLVYVLYTSGSTGTPKGVQVQHNSFASHLHWFNRQYQISGADSTVLLSSFSFDGSMTSMWPVLLAGGTLHLPVSPDFDPAVLLAYIAQKKITYLKTLPGILRTIVYDAAFTHEDCSSVRLIIVGGEKTDAEVFRRYIDRYPEILFSNHYGPTECTISCSYYLINKSNCLPSDGRQLIGIPVANTKMYICGTEGQLNPAGVVGEICIGGLQVTRGYLNLPGLTAERFVPDNISAEPGGRLYRTGDMGRWLPGGNVEFLGRRDEQVKIRGYRVELGEIETIISQNKNIRQAVVVAKEINEGNSLVAYVVSEGLFNREELVSLLKRRLPDYMVPSKWVEMAALPLTSNGKIDKQALAAADDNSERSNHYAAPRDEAEEKLVNIWQELLKKDRVGIDDNFFETGGHSLLAIRVISAIRKAFNIELGVKDIFRYPTIATLAPQVKQQTVVIENSSIGVQQRPEYIPLSFGQERLWFIDRLEGSIQYHIPLILRLRGKINPQALEFAIQNTVNRHEVLRTVIREHDGAGYQYILDPGKWKLSHENVSSFSDNGDQIQAHVLNLIRIPFNLSSAYPLRVTLLKLDEEDHLLVAVMHHISSDGWSTSILVQEVAHHYQSFTSQRETLLPPLAIQYADYAIWQRGHLDKNLLHQKLTYWKNKLGGVAPLDLPTDFLRPLIPGTDGALFFFEVGKEIMDGIARLGQRHGSTLFITLLAAFKAMLYRCSGQEDICVGTSVAGRDRQEVEGLIGFFNNIIALRSEIDGEMPFAELLEKVKTTTLEAYAHQDVPFEQVVDAVVRERETSRNPVCQVMLVLQNTPEVPELALNDVQLSTEAYDHTTAQYELVVRLKENPAGMRGSIEYRTDLYSVPTIERFAGYFKNLLIAIVAMPEQSISGLSMLNPAEEQRLLVAFNDTKAILPPGKTLVNLFEVQAGLNPFSEALIFGSDHVTYQELNERSNQLAHYLLYKGVTHEALVAICLERSIEMVVGIMAILKAGGAYVPIDPTYPAERISYILNDTATTLVLCDSTNSSKLWDLTNAEILAIDQLAIVGMQPKTNPALTIHPAQLAYVIYTSGSTGAPKGVMVEHGGVVNLASGQAAALELKQGMRTLQFASFAFDASCYEIFNTLLSGGCLVLCSSADILSTDSFKNIIRTNRVEVAVLPPSYQHIIEETLDTLKVIVSAGEPLNVAIGRKIQAKGIRLVNAYGPTENTVCVSLTDEPIRNGRVSIGKPIANVQVYILDKAENLAPMGTVGEICVGGAQVARGYLNRADLTAEKFVADPFSSIAGSRLYKTGDLGRWFPDGNIEYTGRIDDQVKIRGYRVEPGEIETVLLESTMVSQAVVLAEADVDGSRRLKGYVVPQAAFDKQAMTAFLGTRLPDYMIPGVWVEVDEMPLTPNGKIDRKALTEYGETHSKNKYVAPHTETEEKLVTIWQDLLEVDKIGVEDNFFELGGHSLLAIRLTSIIRRELEIEVAIGVIFEHPTIRSFAAQFEINNELAKCGIERYMRPEFIPLSFSQERLWFIDQLEGSTQYHVPLISRLTGRLNQEALLFAIKTIVKRHEVLRTVIREHDGQGYQVVKNATDFNVRMADGAACKDDAAHLKQYLQQLVSTPFNLSEDFLIRAHLIQLDETDHILVVTIHHIASDGWSLSVMIRELTELYSSFVEDRAYSLPKLQIQFVDYSIWQRNYLQGEVLKHKLEFWKTHLDGILPLELPTDFVRPAVQSSRGAVVKFSTDNELAGHLYDLSQQHGATFFMTLLAAFKVLLYRYSGQQDICVGTPIANRSQQEIESLIGFFANTLALRSSLNGEASFVEVLKQIRKETLEAYEHQDVPFEKVVDAVAEQRDMSRTSLFQVLFVLQNTPDVPRLQLGDVQLSAEQYDHITSKFDLTLTLTETGDGLLGSVEYSTDLFKEETIERLIGSFKELLNAIVKMPQQSIALLPVLTVAEERRLLEEFSATDVQYPQNKTVISLFEAQAKFTPNATALVFEDRAITYRLLNEQVNQMAAFLLQQYELGADDTVGVMLNRSVWSAVVMLAILKTGACYVPVDPDLPQTRIQYIITDSAPKVILCDAESAAKHSGLYSGEFISVHTLKLETYSIENPNSKINLDDLSFIIYTSGSTGVPKGVMQTHRTLVNLINWDNALSGLDAGLKLLQYSSFGFDSSLHDICFALSNGGSAFILSEEFRLDFRSLATYICTHGIEIISLPFSALSSFFNIIDPAWLNNHQIKHIISTGEQLIVGSKLAEFVRLNPAIRLHNFYGPSETHVVTASSYTGAEVLPLHIPIGKPISNSTIYIVDAYHHLVPIGVSGEVYIGGDNLARGYLGNEVLTNDKFVPHFFKQDALLYRSGDLGRWLADGNIEYLGRMDDQLKIRGYRIELGEIESVLNQSEKIRQAVVIAKADKKDKRLVAYVVSEGDFNREETVTWLKTRLPEYMVPLMWVEMETFPLTLNGKIDKRALPDPDMCLLATTEYAPPRNEMEEQLSFIWRELLEVERVGIYDNFFELGGHSLLAIRIISSVRKLLGIEAGVKELFLHPTVADLSSHLEHRAPAMSLPGIEVHERPDYIPLSFGQERLWFIDRLEGTVQYHLPAVLRLKGTLNIKALEYAFKTVVNRHEVLRTVIWEHDGNGYQNILQQDNWKLGITEDKLFKTDPGYLQQRIKDLVQAPFDLSNDSMLRTTLIPISDQEYLLVFVAHHIAADGWSFSILVKEVVEIYSAFVENRTAKLSPLPVQFADFAIWQRKELNEKVLDKKIGYWKEKLMNVAPLDIPLDFARPAVFSKKGAFTSFLIEKDLKDKLNLLSTQQGVTLYMTLLSVLKVLLHRYSGKKDICVGTTIAGRQQQEIESLIGFFLNTLALRDEVSGDDTFKAVLQKVKTTTLEAYENQEVPFERVVNAVSGERDKSSTPLFQVVLVLQNTPELPKLEFAGVELIPEKIDTSTVKYELIYTITETESGLQCVVQFAADLYREETILLMVEQFKNLLNSIVDEPDQKIGAVAMLNKTQAQQLHQNATEVKMKYQWDKTMVDLFEEQVTRKPSSIALIFEEEQLTYIELNGRANQLAARLIELDVEPETLVPICIERSLEMVIGILAILKIGAAYVPIDPAYPAERITLILQDTRATVVLTGKEHTGKFADSEQVLILDIENSGDFIDQPAENLNTEIEPNHVAYVIYTSGSTGKPKGVSIMHRSNVNMSLDQVRQFGITDEDRVLQFASVSFDASVSEIFMAFYAGAALVLIPKERIQDAPAFPAYMAAKKVSVVTLPPVYLKAFKTEDLKFLRVIITAGEQADVLLSAELSRYVDVYNAYGPTEYSVCASIYKVAPDDASRDRIPIGKPIANTHIYILDDEMQVVPAGVQGEIFMSGMGLAKGYLGQPRLTAEKFVANPFGTGKKLYRTGDIGRWLNDGNIEFLGRKDDQVKIRGYRVEPGEIETNLDRHPDVQKSVVVVNELKDDKQLVAYYQPKSKVKLWPSVAEFYVYDDLLYKTMAGDEARNAKYRNALGKVIKDKIVLEIGPGFEAILSRICIEEGARKVYAVELLEESYLKAKKVVENLGLEERIIVIHGDITQVNLPEKVDYCVSEIVGAIGGSEGAASLINASRHLLKDPSCMIPARSLTKIAAITLPADNFDCGFEELGAYYTNRIFEQAGRKFDLRVYLSAFPKSNIISEEGVFEDLDYTKECSLEDEHTLRMSIQQESTMHGFIVWLNLYCDSDELIDTVEGKYTWLPIYFPVFFHGEKVSSGDYIEAKVTRSLSSNKLNPDFTINGRLCRRNKSDLPFTYESFYCSETFRGNDFYTSIFENGEAKIVEQVSKDELRDFLRSRLPEYMIPSLFIKVDQFALTVSGKINRKALPPPVAEEIPADKYIEPRTQTEKALVNIWEQVLEVEKPGVNDDFFELGGHSLLAIRLISVIRKELNIEVAIGDVFDYPTIRALAASLESEQTKTLLPPVNKQPRPEYIPLSFSQERLWFIDQLEGSLHYHLPTVLRLKGKLNTSALFNAIKGLLERHEVLRTVIREHEGKGYQYILTSSAWQLQTEDGTHFNNGQTALTKHIHELITAPFNLSEDYLLRAKLIALSGEEHLLVVTIHHIASDGWSLSILVKELTELYAAYVQERPATLPQLPVQYADYSLWQRHYLVGGVLNANLEYWKTKLAGLTPLRLLTGQTRPAIQSTKGAVVSFEIKQDVAEKLNVLGKQEGTTLFITLLAAFNTLLYHYSGQTDICVGTPIAGRRQHEVEGLIGFFLNTLALRSNVDALMPFTNLLQQVKTTMLQAQQHQDVPFEKVVEAVVQDRDRSQNPLFQVMMVLHNNPAVPRLTMGDLQLSAEPIEHNTSKFDFTFFFTETPSGLHGLAEYCVDLYEEETINRLILHFQQLLRSIVAGPQQKVGELQLLTSAEEDELVSTFNNTVVQNAENKSIAGLFQEQVKRTPDATAMVFEASELSYRTLNERSNQLAHYLLSKGVEAQALVPLCIERSFNMIVGVLGILKAGATYVPIDPEYPADRIAYMLGDLAATVAVSSKAASAHMAGKPNLQIIALDTDWAHIGRQPTHDPVSNMLPEHLAYVLYTSGSTGIPKGVQMPNGALVNLLLWQQKQFGKTRRKVLQFASLNFDVSFQEIFSTLGFGSELHLMEEKSRRDLNEMSRQIAANGITHLFVPYIVLKTLAETALSAGDELTSLTEIITAGEQLKLTPDIKEFLHKNQATLINQYGPTEAHVVSSYTVLNQPDANPLPPIGKPVDNVQLYVLNAANRLCPAGVAGELCIGGAQVARGYLNRPELTAEKFIADPFSPKQNARLYKTGDLARWLPDGNLEYLGRKDEQVKIRGYRVEPGEIENVLQQSGLVSQAVVVAKEDTGGNQQLIAYVVAEENAGKEQMMAWLAARLPNYMVPLLWVQMEQLPLSPNGKVDKRALPGVDANARAIREYVAPQTETQQKLAAIWQELLGIEKVGIHDNFFELGGHSILLMRLTSQIKKHFMLAVPIKVLFEFNTISGFSNYLDWEHGATEDDDTSEFEVMNL